MKLFSHVAAVLSIALIFTASGLAQKKMSREEQFKEIAKLSNSKKAEDKSKAYTMSKAFIEEFGKEAGPDLLKIKGYVLNVSIALLDDHVQRDDTVSAYSIGEYILDLEPGNVNVYMTLAWAGFQNLANKKDRSFNNDTVEYATKALEILNGATPPAAFNPFNSLDEAKANMYYVQGYIFIGSDIKKAAMMFQKSIAFESKIKNSAFPYAVIANYYEGAYNKRVSEFKVKTGLTQAQQDAEFKIIDMLIENLIDAYARTVKVAEAENNPELANWKVTYATLYKFWKKSDAGADKMLASVMSTPMPEVK